MQQLRRKLGRFANNPLVASGAPLFVLVVVGSVGLSVLVQSKLELRGAARGYNSVEEYDPLDALKRRAQQAAPPPNVTSLEDELQDIQRKVNINDFKYKPVPRQEEEE